MKELFRHVADIISKRKKKAVWQEFTIALACIIGIITAYMLVMPALTIEKNVACGIPEHQHSEECYETRLVCGLEEYDDSSYEEGGGDVIAEDDYSDIDMIEE